MTGAFEALCGILCGEDFDDILLVCHANPDGDTLGSAFALCLGLKKMGKRVAVAFEPREDHTFDYITDLAQEADFPVRHVITVDVASPELMGKIRLPAPVDAVIDHHKNNRMEAEVKLCLPDRAACGEIIFELLEALEIPMDEAIARCLYTAIAADTGRFCYPNTTHRTLSIAARLCTYAPSGNFADINKRVFETVSIQKLRLEAYAVEQVRFFGEGALAALVITEEERARLGASESDFEGLINVLRRIEGVRAAAFIRPREGQFKVSLRADPGIDCAAICARFGGGGHAGAAGCTLDGDAETALSRITEAVCEVL